MPEISAFDGTRVTMYWNDRVPPHFHAEYSGRRAAIAIEDADMDQIPEVVQVMAGPGQLVYAWLADGSVRLYDAAPLIAQGGVFAPLADPALFEESLMVANGTLAWDVEGGHDPRKVLDVAPEAVHAAPQVADPLEEQAA
ncbi:MAG: DUF4160 domain-containing protein [Bifidobacteriaceae bacterium]|nr:DUF4160 domain-containing protein [Bifidobacteriaceae bacterium]